MARLGRIRVISVNSEPLNAITEEDIPLDVPRFIRELNEGN